MSATPAIRVLLTSPPSSRLGGVTQYLQTLRPHLGDGVHYFTVGSRSDGEPIATSVMRMLRDSWLFARTLRSGGYDIVHLNPSVGPKALVRDGVLLAAAKALHKEVVVFVHGWDDECMRILSTRFSGLFRLVYGRADAFIVLGSDFKNRLRVLGYDGTVFVHRAPVEDELLRYCERPTVGGATGVSNPRFKILFLARVEVAKGVFEALETYQILKQQYPGLSLVVAGAGTQLEKATTLVQNRQLADVSFAGEIHGEAKYAVLRAADAYLFPSHSEGLPISVLEAMACGLPVVTRSVGGLQDFFEHGKMGFITASHEPRVFASLLSRLIQDPMLRSRMSAFNHAYAREHFTAPQIAAQLGRVYRLLRESAHPAVLRAG